MNNGHLTPRPTDTGYDFVTRRELEDFQGRLGELQAEMIKAINTLEPIVRASVARLDRLEGKRASIEVVPR